MVPRPLEGGVWWVPCTSPVQLKGIISAENSDCKPETQREGVCAKAWGSTVTLALVGPPNALRGRQMDPICLPMGERRTPNPMPCKHGGVGRWNEDDRGAIVWTIDDVCMES